MASGPMPTPALQPTPRWRVRWMCHVDSGARISAISHHGPPRPANGFPWPWGAPRAPAEDQFNRPAWARPGPPGADAQPHPSQASLGASSGSGPGLSGGMPGIERGLVYQGVKKTAHRISERQQKQQQSRRSQRKRWLALPLARSESSAP